VSREGHDVTVQMAGDLIANWLFVSARRVVAEERRDVRSYANVVKPELLATRPNELWSWDIIKLLGPKKWTYFYLYVLLDVYSRYVVGWMVATRESKQLARKLIEETLRKHGIAPGQLTLHADRGSSMTSKPVAFLCADLGVSKTHSRPYVSNNNPFSEAQFKTLKYPPTRGTRDRKIYGRRCDRRTMRTRGLPHGPSISAHRRAESPNGFVRRRRLWCPRRRARG
jgi:transposase InsO family protein